MKSVIALLAAIFMASTQQPAHSVPVPEQQAQQMPICDTRDKIVSQLTNKYGFTVTGGGFSKHTEDIVEHWLSKETGVWSIVTTNRKGISCLVVVGGGWTIVPQGEPT